MADVSNRATHFFLNIPSYTVESLFYGSVAEDAVVGKKKNLNHTAFLRKSTWLSSRNRRILKPNYGATDGLGRSWLFIVILCARGAR